MDNKDLKKIKLIVTLQQEEIKLSINIYLTDKFLGKCWHDRKDFSEDGYGTYNCKKCGKRFGGHGGSLENKDLFTPAGFFLLWNKAQKEEWWESFLDYVSDNHYKSEDELFLLKHTVNPLTFPTLLAEYLGWKEDK